MRITRYIPLMTAAALIALFVAGSATAQQKEGTEGAASAAEVQALKARIEQLENQNQAIVQQNDAMMKLLTELKAKLTGPPQATDAAANATVGAAGSAVPANIHTQPSVLSRSGASPGEAGMNSGVAGPATSAAGGNSASKAAAAAQEEAPLTFHIGRAAITPVGFLDFTSVFRSTNTGTGLPTSFGSIPFHTAANGNLTEERFSTQNSRIGLRADADVGDAHVFGYLEADFLGTLAPGNLVTTVNGNLMRMREYYVDVRKGKFEFVGGQAWSLINPNRKGLGPDHKDLFFAEKNLDPNEQLGLVTTRSPGVRFLYHGSDAVTLGFAAENPDQYIGGSSGGPTITLPAALATAFATQLDNSSNSLAVPNLHPDLIAKVAFDPIIGDKLFHIEVGGVDRSFKVFNPISKQTFTSNGGGGTVGINFQLFKHFHLLSNNFYGDGGGRYLFGQAPDLIVRPDGSLSLMHSAATLDGIEAELGPKTELWSYYGMAYVDRNVAFDTNHSLIGYGFAGSPASQNRISHEATFGMNHQLWRDPKYGALRLAFQYSYVIRHPWAVAPGAPSDAHTNMLYVGVRYYLPGEAPKYGK